MKPTTLKILSSRHLDCGNNPSYDVNMFPDTAAYEEALHSLATIERLKRELHLMANQLCRTAANHMFLPARDIEHALGVITEAFNDLFYVPAQEACRIQEHYEHADRQSALHEWDSTLL